jgi:uncharacterized protein YndB with AHSA1/START domain
MTARATGQHARRDGEDTVVFTRTFAAPIAAVWASVTESDRLARWFGTWSGDPASGAVQVQMNAEGDAAEESTYQITACEPPRLLRLRSVNDYGIWDMTIELAHRDGTTTLTFSHLVTDLSMIESVGPGWDYYLDRLVAAETGGDPASLDFDRDYYPALRDHYLAVTERIRA